jgi:hypothetical protein
MKTEERDEIGLLARRFMNALGRPFGINPFPRAFPNPLSEGAASRQEVFERVYNNNYWASDQSRSGLGSEKAFTENYRRELRELVLGRELVSIFDAPCGDLNWMPDVIAATGIRYIGGDISPGVVEGLRHRHPGFDIRILDICEDIFPLADVWHCRDCLFHLPFANIRQAFLNYVSSQIPYALLTTHKALWHRNLDVTAGGFRYLDLEREPINLPKAMHYLKDYRPGVDFPRYVGLWPRESIARALDVWI